MLRFNFHSGYDCNLGFYLLISFFLSFFFFFYPCGLAADGLNFTPAVPKEYM